jgi:hypothetical protein
VAAAAWLAMPAAPVLPAQARQLAVEILNGGERQAIGLKPDLQGTSPLRPL